MNALGHKVVLSDGSEFICLDDQTILEAARFQGIVLEHSCRIGRCNSCIQTIEIGEAVCKATEKLSKPGDKIFTCNSVPISELKISGEDISKYNFAEPKIIVSKVLETKRISKNWILLSLKISPKVNFEYTAGQYMDFLLANGIRRSFSIYRFIESKNRIEFLISVRKPGVTSDFITSRIREGELIRLHGPYGTFSLRETKKEKVMFVANGTGLAPIANIIENQILLKQNLSNFHEVCLIWGVKSQEYLDGLYSELWKRISFFHTFSNDNLSGSKFYVQDFIKETFSDLDNYAIYACGSSKMLSGLEAVLDQANIIQPEIYAECFD